MFYFDVMLLTSKITLKITKKETNLTRKSNKKEIKIHVLNS